MEKLSEVKQALKYLEIDAKAYADNFSASMIVSTKNILAIAEAFRALDQEVQKNLDGALAWQQRAEAAEAKLVELEQQEPVAYVHPAYLQAGALGFDASVGRLAPAQIPLFTRPARAADLAELVPEEMTPEMMKAVQCNSELGAYAAANLAGAYDLFDELWKVARTTMLSKIEEANK